MSAGQFLFLALVVATCVGSVWFLVTTCRHCFDWQTAGELRQEAIDLMYAPHYPQPTQRRVLA